MHFNCLIQQPCLRHKAFSWVLTMLLWLAAVKACLMCPSILQKQGRYSSWSWFSWCKSNSDLLDLTVCAKNAGKALDLDTILLLTVCWKMVCGMFTRMLAWEYVLKYVLKIIQYRGRSRYLLNSLGNWEGKKKKTTTEIEFHPCLSPCRMTMLSRALSVVLLPKKVVPFHGRLFLLKFLEAGENHQLSWTRMKV